MRVIAVAEVTMMDDASETDAFAESLVGELPRLVRLATRLVRDAAQAEDCAQETIVGAWRRRDQLRDPAALSAWLRRSLVNRIIDRSRVHRDELDIDAVEADWRDDRYSVAPDRVLERAELRDELEDALARLPVIYRVPVVLHDVVGWTAAEIGRAMDAGLPATKQRLRRGRMMLVSALAEGDERRQASLAAAGGRGDTSPRTSMVNSMREPARRWKRTSRPVRLARPCMPDWSASRPAWAACEIPTPSSKTRSLRASGNASTKSQDGCGHERQDERAQPDSC
jgi:RNA polymerase sigma-70 factor (ECF subfamily)